MSQALHKYNARVDAANTLLCVGLDPEFKQLPARFHSEKHPQFAFNKWIIEQTAEVAAAFKPNMAFYEARGVEGITELAMTMEYLRAEHPSIFTICDAKRADIGNTNRGYVEFVFDRMGCDSITLHPYLGGEAMQPFLEREDKMSIVLCRTSNVGAREFQDLECNGRPLWQSVAERVNTDWNAHSNCALVVGATYPKEMRAVREIAPRIPLLVPGVGAQGGDASAVVAAGMDADGRGLMINSSRGIIFSDDPAAAARTLRNEINAARSLNTAGSLNLTGESLHAAR